MIKTAIALGLYAAAAAVAPVEVAACLLAAPALVFAACWVLRRPARWVHVFLILALVLPPLPIALGNTGPHPALAVAGIGLFAGILFLPGWQLPANLLACSSAVFVLVLLASVAPALAYSGLEIAAGALARVFLFGLSLYVFFYAAHGPRDGADAFRFTRVLFVAATVAALFACVDFYFQFPAPAGFGPQFVWLDSGIYRRAQGLFSEASTLGNFYAFFLTMIAVAVTRPKGQAPFSRFALLAGGVAFLAALVFSYSRGSLVNLAVALATLAILERRGSLARAVIALPVVAALAGWAAYTLLPELTGVWWLRVQASAQYLLAAPEGVLSGRLASWAQLAEFAARNPLATALGIGYKTLPYTTAFGRPVVADNMYLSILVETGIAGLCALLVFNFALLRESRRAARSPDWRTAFFGTWFFCFWMGQLAQMLTGDLLTYWRVLPVYFWVLAMAVRHAHPVS